MSNENVTLWGTPYEAVRALGGDELTERLVARREADGLEVLVTVVRLEAVAGHDGLESREALGDRVRLQIDAHRAVARHPNVVALLDAGITPDGRPYFATALDLDAKTLREEIASRGRLDAGEACRIAVALLDALEAAHGAGLVHRDIKPSSVFIGDGRIRLGDFAVVKVLDVPGAPRKPDLPTETGKVLGAARFVAPEVALGKPAEPRSDLYQVGLLLFECLTGQGPFDVGTHGPAGWIRAHALGNLPSVSTVAPDVTLPEGLEDLLRKALAKLPNKRFQSAAEMRGALLPFALAGHVADTERIDRAELAVEQSCSKVTSSESDQGTAPMQRGELGALIEQAHPEATTPIAAAQLLSLQQASLATKPHAAARDAGGQTSDAPSPSKVVSDRSVALEIAGAPAVSPRSKSKPGLWDRIFVISVIALGLVVGLWAYVLITRTRG